MSRAMQSKNTTSTAILPVTPGTISQGLQYRDAGLTQRNSDRASKSAAELSPVVTFAGQHLRDIKPRVRSRRLLLEHGRIDPGQRDNRPVVPEVLLLGLSVRLLGFPGTVVCVAD